jgi:hypothetical protein
MDYLLREVWQERQFNSCRDSLAAGQKTGKRMGRQFQARLRNSDPAVFTEPSFVPNSRFKGRVLCGRACGRQQHGSNGLNAITKRENSGALFLI